MASINFEEIRQRLQGLTINQLEKLDHMITLRLEELRKGAKIQPYDPRWSKSPPAPQPVFNKPPRKYPSSIGNPETSEGAYGLEDDNDVPF